MFKAITRLNIADTADPRAREKNLQPNLLCSSSESKDRVSIKSTSLVSLLLYHQQPTIHETTQMTSN